MARKYWSINYFDSGSGTWISDRKIPRAGLETFSRIKEANIEFIELVDSSEAKISFETKSKYTGEITLVFPKEVITETVKNQFLSYIDNERGIKIPIPIITGASSYTEKVIMGYPVRYQEDWVLDNKNNQRFIIKLSIHEFSVDGT